MKKRLSKALAAAGIASRRACEEVIFQGRVCVNAQVVKHPQFLIDWKQDRITVDGDHVQAEEEKVYFLINKPTGYLCTNTASKRSVLHFFPHVSSRLFTIGRLDKDTSGLLLVTNDGIFANRVIHPSHAVKKEYLAKTGQEICCAHLRALSKGTWVEGVYVKPLSVKKVRRGTVKIVICEGKKHEVRRLLASAKLSILQLKRTRLGPFTLNSLSEGAYRELSEKEKAIFLN